MLKVQRYGLCGLAVVLMFTAIGCPVGEPRTSNQGGGSLLTVGQKLMDGGRIGDMTADELQILCDNIPNFAGPLGIQLPPGTTIPQLNDEQAGALEALLNEKNITTIDELNAAINNGTITESDLPDALKDLFI